MAKKRVLIVDDDPDVVAAVRFALEAEGIGSVDARNGAEALELAKQARPDLILLDIMLPKVNGYSVAWLLKGDVALKHIPIIMLTAKTERTDVELGASIGAEGYVTKPFDIDQLVGLVKEYLDETTPVAEEVTNG